MTITDVRERYQIPVAILEEYDRWQLRQTACTAGTYDAEDIEYLSMILTLHDVGFAAPDVERYMRLLLSPLDTRRERMRMLSALRAEAIEEIHAKQRRLDRLDYLRYQMQSQL